MSKRKGTPYGGVFFGDEVRQLKACRTSSGPARADDSAAAAAAAGDGGGLPCLHETTVAFLHDLASNNSSDWVKSNKKHYDAARADFQEFVKGIIAQVAEFDPALKDLDPKNCIFKMNRDLRFTPDQRPYKTSMSAFLSYAGDKKTPSPGYYVCVDPSGESMFGGGMWCPSTTHLDTIRKFIDDGGDKQIGAVTNDASFKQTFGDDPLAGCDRLKTAPKGYAKNHPSVRLLQLKSFHVGTKVEGKDIDFYSSSALAEAAVDTFRALRPWNHLLCEVIGINKDGGS
ncbi:unnamed protein product [Vitrella brassicaformis CCMP3155]|uniref:DUF2461 domain-containing protein n=2 Tax=Vitrella brassicaformis TaxID=1169539 RepID=A0A0G4FFR2_VITBC|nr:unnamed protein product [Vitrella brassicaformis CCMP3155]|mmetsp:Transcript_53985/g.135689  ORF Transcript_53985/g.135689 Transcript_53985/m.135689 type:complete len:285 (+) Transcript_53985:17-871(+)|eukprot:CEM11882.1 unnamed protein product [Vitrella brassicaformis CCMP3155]